MNTQRNAAHRLEEDIANAGVPPRSDQVPLLEKDMNDEHTLVNPLPLMDGDIRVAFLHMAEAITTQTQVSTTQRKHDDPSKSRGCTSSSSTSCYHGLLSKGFH